MADMQRGVGALVLTGLLVTGCSSERGGTASSPEREDPRQTLERTESVDFHDLGKTQISLQGLPAVRQWLEISSGNRPILLPLSTTSGSSWVLNGISCQRDAFADFSKIGIWGMSTEDAVAAYELIERHNRRLVDQNRLPDPTICVVDDGPAV